MSFEKKKKEYEEMNVANARALSFLGFQYIYSKLCISKLRLGIPKLAETKKGNTLYYM